jgi:hypothetical protein
MVKCNKNDTESKCRSFTIAGSGTGYQGSRFISPSPSAAAAKAGSRLYQLLDTIDKKGKFSTRESVKFIIRELTRGSEKKTFYFVVSRTKKDEPLVRKIGDKEVVYMWDYKVTSCPGDDKEIKKIEKSL